MSNRAMIRGVINSPEHDPYWDKVVSLLHFNGDDESTDIVDEKGLSWTIYGDVYISTDQSKFGGSSLYVDGVGNDDLLGTTIPKIEYDNFTIEGWFYFISSDWMILCGGGWGVNDFILRVNPENIGIMSDTDHVLGGREFTFSSSFVTDTWYHLVLQREDGVFAIYRNGVQVGTSETDINIQTTYFGVGRGYILPHNNMKGYIDDFRITKGVARYTSNFTPPTKAFPNR